MHHFNEISPTKRIKQSSQLFAQWVTYNMLIWFQVDRGECNMTNYTVAALYMHEQILVHLTSGA